MKRKNAEIRLERISNDFLAPSRTDWRTSLTLLGVRTVHLWPKRPFLSVLMLPVASHLYNIRIGHKQTVRTPGKVYEVCQSLLESTRKSLETRSNLISSFLRFIAVPRYYSIWSHIFNRKQNVPIRVFF